MISFLWKRCKNYVCIYTPDKKYISYLTFKTVEYIGQSQFLKIHKSFIVAIAKIESIEGNEIKIGAHALPISRASKEEVMGKNSSKPVFKKITLVSPSRSDHN